MSGLFSDDPGALFGIAAWAPGAQISGNRVSGFDMTTLSGGAVPNAYGIALKADYQRASGNHVSGDPEMSASGAGIDVVESSS